MECTALSIWGQLAAGVGVCCARRGLPNTPLGHREDPLLTPPCHPNPASPCMRARPTRIRTGTRAAPCWWWSRSGYPVPVGGHARGLISMKPKMGPNGQSGIVLAYLARALTAFVFYYALQPPGASPYLRSATAPAVTTIASVESRSMTWINVAIVLHGWPGARMRMGQVRVSGSTCGHNYAWPCTCTCVCDRYHGGARGHCGTKQQSVRSPQPARFRWKMRRNGYGILSHHCHIPIKHCRTYSFIYRTKRGDAVIAQSPVKRC